MQLPRLGADVQACGSGDLWIGARLDKNPSLFFELRGIEVGGCIDVAIANRVEVMLKNAGRKSARIIRDDGIRELFGV